MINLPTNVPHHGFVMTLTNDHKQGDVSTKQLQEDVFALMGKLNNQSVLITIKNITLQIKLFILTEITGQSFKEDFVEEKSATIEDIQPSFSKNPGNIKIKSPITPREDAYRSLMRQVQEFYHRVKNKSDQFKPSEFTSVIQLLREKQYAEALENVAK